MLTWRIAWRDLRGISGGFRLLATALVLGVAGIAAVGSIADGLLEGARASAREAVGGDLSFRLFHRQPTADERSFLGAFGELGEVAELRTRAARPDGAAATLVELKAIDGAYPLYGSLVLDPPLTPEAALGWDAAGSWGAVVDDELLEALDLAVGDVLRLGSVDVAIRARVVAEPDRALRAFALGPRVLVSQPALAATGLATPGAALYWYSRLRLPAGQDPAAVIAAVETRFPHAGWRIVDAADGIPGIERSIALGRAVALSLALAMLVIGGLGIAGAVTAHLGQKTPNIAILKTLGATSRQVTAIYLAQLLVVAVAATLAGLLLGALAAAAIGSGLPVAGHGPLRLHPQALALAGGMALVTTLLFALRPLERVRRTSPMALLRLPVAHPSPGDKRDGRGYGLVAIIGVLALALGGLVLAASELPLVTAVVLLSLLVIGALFSLWARALAAAARRLRPAFGHAPLIRLALANLSSPGAPTSGTVTALGLGLTALVAVATLQVLAVRHVAATLPATAPTLVVINLPSQAGQTLHQLIGERRDVARMRVAPFLHGRVTHLDGTPVRDARVPRDLAWVVRGDRGLSWPLQDSGAGQQEGEPTSRRQGASLAADIAARFGLDRGDRLTLDVQGEALELTITGLHEVDWTGLDLDFPILLEPPAEPPPHSLVAAVWLAAGTDPEPLIGMLGEHYPAAAVIRLADVLGTLGELLGGLGRALQIATLATLLAAGLVLAGGIAAGYRQRAAQGAILLSQGATRRQLARAAALELGMVGLASALPAVVLGNLVASLVATRIAPGLWQFDPLVSLGAAGLATLALAALGHALPSGTGRLRTLSA
jgi:putative ABC transport system permease protein